jgi:signal transduction histidine kinase
MDPRQEPTGDGRAFSTRHGTDNRDGAGATSGALVADSSIDKVVHDLRGPLATISVAASTLRARRTHLTDEQQDFLLAQIEASVEQVRGVADELLLGALGLDADGAGTT